MEPIALDEDEIIFKAGSSKKKKILVCLAAVLLFVVAFVLGYAVRLLLTGSCDDHDPMPVVDDTPLHQRYQDSVQSISASNIDEYLK